MKISYGRRFKKMFAKQSRSIQEKFEKRLDFLVKGNIHPSLNIHALHGEWIGCKSINVTGDIQAVFEEINMGHIEFVAIGSHSELFS